MWRNGRRDRLKICFSKGSGGSSPSTGTTARNREQSRFFHFRPSNGHHAQPKPTAPRFSQVSFLNHPSRNVGIPARRGAPTKAVPSLFGSPGLGRKHGTLRKRLVPILKYPLFKGKRYRVAQDAPNADVHSSGPKALHNTSLGREPQDFHPPPLKALKVRPTRPNSRSFVSISETAPRLLTSAPEPNIRQEKGCSAPLVSG